MHLNPVAKVLRASLAELLLHDLEPTLAACACFLASSGAATSPAKGHGCQQEPPSAATPGSSGSQDYQLPHGVSCHLVVHNGRPGTPLQLNPGIVYALTSPV